MSLPYLFVSAPHRLSLSCSTSTDAFVVLYAADCMCSKLRVLINKNYLAPPSFTLRKVDTTCLNLLSQYFLHCIPPHFALHQTLLANISRIAGGHEITIFDQHVTPRPDHASCANLLTVAGVGGVWPHLGVRSGQTQRTLRTQGF